MARGWLGVVVCRGRAERPSVSIGTVVAPRVATATHAGVPKRPRCTSASPSTGRGSWRGSRSKVDCRSSSKKSSSNTSRVGETIGRGSTRQYPCPPPNPAFEPSHHSDSSRLGTLQDARTARGVGGWVEAQGFAVRPRFAAPVRRIGCGVSAPGTALAARRARLVDGVGRSPHSAVAWAR